MPFQAKHGLSSLQGVVADELWQAAKGRQRGISALFGPNFANTREGRTRKLHLTNRPVTLLSSLLVRGRCCGRISRVMTGRYSSNCSS